MKTEFTGRFYKDIDKITQPSVKSELLSIILQVEEAKQLAEIKNIKKNLRDILQHIVYGWVTTELVYSMKRMLLSL